MEREKNEPPDGLEQRAREEGRKREGGNLGITHSTNLIATNNIYILLKYEVVVVLLKYQVTAVVMTMLTIKKVAVEND